MKSKKVQAPQGRKRLMAMMVVSLLVISTGALWAVSSLRQGDFVGGIAGAFIMVSILAFAVFVFLRGNRDMREGFPLQDERSRRVMEKATSKAFLISLYLLLAIGFLSDDVIHFRDVSQATSVAVGGMALLFLFSWIYYNRKAL